MMRLHQSEIRLKKEGFFSIAGIDEAGRGPWAGPLVAAAAILPPNTRIPGLNDSKKLTEAQRLRLFAIIIKKANFGIGIVSNKEIDKSGLGKGLKLAFQRSLDNLRKPYDYVLVDGIGQYNFNTQYKTIKKGDSKVRCIAAASIIAKVVRDIIMECYAKKFAQYDFHLHKGYGTKRHQQNLLQYGVCELHRQSFSPIKNILNDGKKGGK